MTRMLLLIVLASCGQVLDKPDTPGPDAPDPCVDGCECTALDQDDTCGTHEVCVIGATSRRCDCAPAYVRSGAACEFAGAPLDPGFTDPSVWVSSGPGAAIDPAFVGTVDLGAAVFSIAGMCDHRVISQTFEMPPLSKAEPFKATVTYTAADPDFNFANAQVLQFDVGGRFFERFIETQPVTETFCLGARDYGGPIDIKIGTFGGPFTCPFDNGTATVSIDQLVFQPTTADECPLPGTILNSDFEGVTGWNFTTRSTGTAAIVDGVGETGSRAARLTTPFRCDEATMTGTIAFPVEGEIANPALEMFYSVVGNNARLTVSLDGKNVAVLEESAPRKARICVPKWALGTTGELGFLMQRNADGGAGVCTTSLNRTATVDSIKIVSDPTCGTTTDLTDPGFEKITVANGPVSGWGITNGHSNDSEDHNLILDQSFSARTGSGVLRLNSRAVCSFAGSHGADLTFIAPAPAGGGAALKFFANVETTNTNSETRVSIGPEIDVLLPETGVYQQHTICLPPSYAGRRVTARFSTGGRGGGCGTYATEQAHVDDVELTTDPTCPAQ